MKKTFLVFSCWLFYVITIAQTPNNDGNWEISIINDDFTGTSVNTTTWRNHPAWTSCLDGACADLTNRTVSSSELHLIAESEPCTCDVSVDKDFTIGSVISEKAFKYGYFEIKCKLPEQTLPVSSTGFSIAFWMYPVIYNLTNHNIINNTTVDQSEIDIFEINCGDFRHTANMHYVDYTNGVDEHLRAPNLFNVDPHDFNDIFSDYHTFSGEWSSNILNIYMDGKLINSSNSTHLKDLVPMNIWAGIMVPAIGQQNQLGVGYNGNTTFPYELIIDYIKIYKLKLDCNTTEIISGTFNFQNFDYKVKKSYTVSNTSLSNTDKVTLRATDFVKLNEGFTVPLGAEFCVLPTECSEQIIAIQP